MEQRNKIVAPSDRFAWVRVEPSGDNVAGDDEYGSFCRLKFDVEGLAPINIMLRDEFNENHGEGMRFVKGFLYKEESWAHSNTTEKELVRYNPRLGKVASALNPVTLKCRQMLLPPVIRIPEFFLQNDDKVLLILGAEQIEPWIEDELGEIRRAISNVSADILKRNEGNNVIQVSP